LLHGKLDRSGFRVEAHEFADGPDGAGIHTTGLVPCIPPRIDSARSGFATGRGGTAARPARASSRCRRSLKLAAGWPAPATRWRRLTSAGVASAERARDRLAFEELFLHQAALAARRQGRQVDRPGIPRPPGELVERWLRVAALRAHRRSTARDRGDRRRPRGRTADAAVADGEVGSGKTVIALYAMLRAVEAGFRPR
jgi:ATP-dependent DNA helicase RecG